MATPQAPFNLLVLPGFLAEELRAPRGLYSELPEGWNREATVWLDRARVLAQDRARVYLYNWASWRRGKVFGESSGLRSIHAGYLPPVSRDRPMTDLSMGAWKDAMRNTRRLGRDVADALSAKEAARTILLGHSLGGAISLYAAQHAAREGKAFAGVITLAAAVSPDNLRWDLVAGGSRGGVDVFFSPSDQILRYIYVPTEFHRPVGLIGPRFEDPAIRAHDVGTIGGSFLGNVHMRYLHRLGFVLRRSEIWRTLRNAA